MYYKPAHKSIYAQDIINLFLYQLRDNVDQIYFDGSKLMDRNNDLMEQIDDLMEKSSVQGYKWDID